MKALFKIAVFLFHLLFTTTGYTLGPEIIANGGFESEFSGDWYASNCQIARVNAEPYEGSWSASVTNRGANWAGISQNVQVTRGRYYYLRAVIRYTNDREGTLWDNADAMVAVVQGDGTTYYAAFGSLVQLRQELGWQHIGGDIHVPDTEITSARIYFQSSAASRNYELDSVSMREIIEDPDHDINIEVDIDNNRKGGVGLSVLVTPPFNPLDLTIEVTQKSRPFAFGSAVVADRISSTDGSNQPYQNFYYNNFEWATIENALKWRQMEWTRGSINYARPEAAVNILNQRGIPVRGHCVTWGKTQNTPDWLQAMSDPEIRSEVTTRINGVVDRFRGRLVHWDVNNEDLNGFFFQERTGNANILTEMFQETRDVDGGAKLFVNDYGAVTYSRHTVALANQARRLRAQGIDAHVGAQGHFGGTPSPPGVIQRRLDTLAEAGGEVWITELDINQPDVNLRATHYENVLKVFYGHPAVRGVIVWGFWDQAHWRPNASLADGPNCEPNAAGLAWNRLVKQEWITNETFYVFDYDDTITFDAFHGDYDLTVKENGNVIKTQSFTVSEGASFTLVEVDVP